MEKPKISPYINPFLCTRCTTCIDLCPSKAIYLDDIDRTVKIDLSRCSKCLRCTEFCPYGAITLKQSTSIRYREHQLLPDA